MKHVVVVVQREILDDVRFGDSKTYIYIFYTQRVYIIYIRYTYIKGLREYPY